MRAIVAVLGVALLAALAFATTRPKSHQLDGYTFERYTADFGKVYASHKEKNMRRALFDERLAAIKQHNANPSHTWRMGVNQLTDRTEAERAKLRGAKVLPRELIYQSKPEKLHQVSGRPIPFSVDYRQANPPILTAVKDQGICGSCWAHASTESIETYWALARGELFVLSQQEINSCTPNPDQCGGTGGCDGNIAELAFDYITSAGGIAQEWVYPYASYFGCNEVTGVCTTPACNTNITMKPVQITGYTAVASNDATAVLDALATVGPLAISVDASTWSDYEGGIFTGCDYAKNISMDHAVQLVGYGHDYQAGLDYWIVRNSWSPAWGESGFIRLHRFGNPTPCGWNVNNSQGSGCIGSPNTIWACGICGIAFDALYPNVAQ